MRDWAAGKLEQFHRVVSQSKIYGNDCKTYNYTREKRTVHVNPDAPLNPLTDLIGVSMGGMDTAISVPKLNLTLDAGPSITETEVTDRIFISHTDTDHINGLSAVMCESIPREKPFDVFISREAKPYIEKLRRKMEKKNAGIKVNFHFVKAGDVRKNDDGTLYEFFDVIHAPTSIGLSIKKRQPDGDWKRILTYTGDVSLKEMFDRGEISKAPPMWDTEILVVEGSVPTVMTGVIPFLNIARARHSSIGDVNKLVKYSHENGGIGKLVMTHVLGVPPFILPCSTVGDDVLRHFKGSQSASFLTTCSEWGRTELKPKTPHSVVS